MNIAAQLYTVREFTQTKEDFLKTLEKIKEIGYESVQLSGIGNFEPEYVKECLDKTGLTVCATHIPAERILNDTEAVIQEHKLWNCQYIGLGYYPDFRFDTGVPHLERANIFVDKFTPAIKKMNESGLTFLYHNHASELEHVSKSKTILEYLCEKFSENKFGILADFYWVQVGGMDTEEFISKFAKYLKVVHFKDLIPKDNAPAMAVVGEGNINYKKIYDTLQKIGTEWIAVEQDNCYGEDPFDCLKRSLENIKKYK